jgi:hypothetical protein
MLPKDLYGLTLTTTAEAAQAYDTALRRILLVQSGAAEAMHTAARADPGFALAHAGLALLGHEFGAPVDVPAALAAAATAARRQCTERERGQVAAITAHILSGTATGAVQAHLRAHPRDALMLAVAMPTIAFAGVTEVPQEAWALVEDLAPAYGGDWWYAGLLAFVRQEQERWTEAANLADRALAVEPSSGHAVHARAHVHYETGDHTAGLSWLDGWIHRHGPAAHHGSHFSWHAALHELALEDPAAVQRRYHAELAPPRVTGVRTLVDSASLLWRADLDGVLDGPALIRPVLDAVDDALLTRPPTPFVAMHSAVALACAGDAAGLARLWRYATTGPSDAFPTVIAPLTAGLLAYTDERFDAAATLLQSVRPSLARLGGSAAQRDIVEDTLLHALLSAGRHSEARAQLEHRLDRRPSHRDQRHLAHITQPVGAAQYA